MAVRRSRARCRRRARVARLSSWLGIGMDVARAKEASSKEGRRLNSLSSQRPASTDQHHQRPSFRSAPFAHRILCLNQTSTKPPDSPPSPNSAFSQAMSSSSSAPPLSIPLISLLPSKPASVLAQEVSSACKTSGFLYITDHGIPQAQIDNAFEISSQFFEGEEQNEKEKVAITVGNKGVSDR